jgi:hypothetical protein
MGLDLTWRYEDRLKFGKCSKDLDKIVKVRLPESSGATKGGMSLSPERDSNYVINHPDVLSDLELLEGETGYALEYTEMTEILNKEELEKRLRKDLEEKYPKDFPQREKVIEDMMQSYFSEDSPFSLNYGTKFIGGSIIHKGIPEVPVKKFIRWVSKKEYDEKVKQAKQRQDDEEVWLFNRWDFQLSYEQRREKCSTCPLNTDISTSKDMPSCYRGTSYSHIGNFLRFISEVDNFPLLREQMNSDGEFKLEDLPQLEDEVKRAIKVLETTSISAMRIYDKDGKEIQLLPNIVGDLYGNSLYGYGVGLEGKVDAISVVFQKKSIFDLPLESRKKIIDNRGLDEIIQAAHEIDLQQPRSYFLEIYKQGDTFYGITKSGKKIELPPVIVNGHLYTPLNIFSIHEEEIQKIEYTEVLAEESFAYIGNLLEKYLNIAKKFQIPILGA